MRNKESHCISTTWFMHLFIKKMLDILGIAAIDKSVQEQVGKIVNSPDWENGH
jgi:hypothetical protein